MNRSNEYSPGPGDLAHVEKDGDDWQLVVAKELRHPPEKVWEALTDPAQIREWAPFDADGNLGTAGAKANLTTIGANYVAETEVTLADRPKRLEYKWGNFDTRWLLQPVEQGTRLTLWINIDSRYIAMGAAGWHIAFDVLDRLLDGKPVGRIAGPDAAKFEGWQRLNKEYRQKFGIDSQNPAVGGVAERE